MPVRLAKDLRFVPLPRCPDCQVGIAPTGRHQPVAVDDEGRPYCNVHGHRVAPEYDALRAEYERIREARAAFLRKAADEGVAPTESEVEEIRLEWRTG